MKRLVVSCFCVLVFFSSSSLFDFGDTANAESFVTHPWTQQCPVCYAAFDDGVTNCWEYVNYAGIESEIFWLVYNNCEMLVGASQYNDWYDWCIDDCDFPR